MGFRAYAASSAAVEARSSKVTGIHNSQVCGTRSYCHRQVLRLEKGGGCEEGDRGETKAVASAAGFLNGQVIWVNDW